MIRTHLSTLVFNLCHSFKAYSLLTSMFFKAPDKRKTKKHQRQLTSQLNANLAKEKKKQHLIVFSFYRNALHTGHLIARTWTKGIKILMGHSGEATN